MWGGVEMIWDGWGVGGSPLLQQGELDFGPAKDRSILKWTFSPGTNSS
jgi:hypothetical protein